MLKDKYKVYDLVIVHMLLYMITHMNYRHVRYSLWTVFHYLINHSAKIGMNGVSQKVTLC